jgi:cobalt-zinc-cadmium efflux system outer membrane protein
MAFTFSLVLAAGETPPATNVLNLAVALSRAEQASPELALARSRVGVVRAHEISAAQRPNPEAELEVEDLGSDGVTTTFSLAQTFELGGKRASRRETADRESQRAASEWQAARADLLAEVASSYLAAWTAQERARLADETAALAEETARTVRQQVAAGKTSPVVQHRADLAANRQLAAAEHANRLRQHAFSALAAHWGEEPDFTGIADGFGDLAPPPAVETVLAALATHPALRLAADEAECRRADLALARTAAIPDLTLRLGASRSDAEKETTFSLAASLPLPLFDRGQGRIAVADATVSESVAALHATRWRLTAQARNTLARLDAEYDQARRLERDLIPAAHRSFAAVREGHAEGKLGYLEVLEAREALAAIQAEYLEALAAFHQTRIELDCLIGGPLAATTEKTRNETR